MFSPRNYIPILLLALAPIAGGFLAGETPAQLKVEKLREIDQRIEEAVEDGQIPGAVLWLESNGQSYHAAYGNRVKFPHQEKMTRDTIFDLASLTKVLATAPAILHLSEKGELSIDDPVSKFLPEFLEGGVHPKSTHSKLTAEERGKIAIVDLLTHQSGLPPSISLRTKEFWGHEEGVRRAIQIGLIEPPKSRFRYSDVNFILLGEIVRRVSGKRIDNYVATHFYRPLGMHRTGFLPKRFQIHQIAPTTYVKDYGLIRGQVHDPVCRRMEGVGGHAGLFSVAEDVAKFCRLFVQKGKCGEVRIFSDSTIELAIRSHTPESFKAPRGLGWDIGSAFAYQRGTKFPAGGYGHTGWTGSSIWIDPASETFLVLLANRNHPDETGSIKQLRIDLGTLAAEAAGYSKRAADLSKSFRLERPDFEDRTAGGDPAMVRNGIDVLEAANFELLAGLKIGLITNHTGVNRERRSTIDLLHKADQVDLRILFSPEHGIRGVLETDSIADGKDTATGLSIYSLYQAKNRKPAASQLAGIDALVFDIQDIGCRFYTYISTMGLAMEAAREHGKKFIVLDRVNPIGGHVFDGPIREGGGNNFVAFHSLPVVHGMTAGELARMFKAERKLGGLNLTVVPVQGWDPRMRFDETGLPWINPSPNIRSLTEALLYPGVGLLEFCNLSVGRGTPTPFEVVGAPWITEGRLVDRLNQEKLPGVQFLPIRFTPNASVYKNEDCGGVRIVITDRDRMNPIDLGLAIGRAILADYPSTFTFREKGNVLLRHPSTHAQWLQGEPTKAIRKLWVKPLKEFKNRREKFLIYPR